MPVTKMTISYYKEQRRKPREGDRKTIKGVEYVRQQVFTPGPWGGYHVRNGRPVYEWVRLEDAREQLRIK